ncbi:MAG: hypothetical protein ACOYYJ_20365 [Chloroflexota bacterium]
MQRTHLYPYRILLIVALLALTLPACGSNTSTPEPAPAQPTAAPTQPAPTDPPQASESALSEYASSNGVFYIKHPSGWAINETPTATGLAFAIAPSRAFIEKRPDFKEPVLLAFGTINQVGAGLAQPANLANLHQQAFSPATGFTFVFKEPTITTPSPYVTYFVTQATSTEANGAVVHWMLGTALADLTVVHFGVGVSDAGFADYGQLALEMFNSVEVDTTVTATLAGQ